ncbi:uncharacterized protein [Penaeus vannamei]|uniref:uncharacterized protein n=1 Tax=Penaeus vannamei TaxID=6689 RepID=UPI00387F6CAF
MSGKAAGISYILAELLKTGGGPMVRGLHAVLAAIWRSGTVPPDLLRGMVIPLWKRIRDLLLRHQRLEQSGFTPGESTIYHILALRVIVECRFEFGRGMFAPYIDLKKTIDTVHRESLWEILRMRGIPTRIIGLKGSLYTGTKSAVNLVYNSGRQTKKSADGLAWKQGSLTLLTRVFGDAI